MDNKETLVQVKKVYQQPRVRLVKIFNDVVTLSIATTFRETGESWENCWGETSTFSE